MASKGIPLALAVEIDAAGPTPIVGQHAALDRGHGRGKSHVGRGTDCVGTAGKARDSGLAAYRAAIHAFRSAIQERARLSGMEFVRAQSCAGSAGLRLLRDGHGDVPGALHLRGLGGGHAPDPALERDRPHPTAEWTAQQFRMVAAGDQSHRFVVHDHDSIYSEGVDRTIAAMGPTVLKTPVRAPQANAFCEQLIGTIRRECLDFVIPLNERHLRRVFREWVAHYNRGRPHTSLGPGIPDPPNDRLASFSILQRPSNPCWSSSGREAGSRRTAPRVLSRANGGMSRPEPVVSFCG